MEASTVRNDAIGWIAMAVTIALWVTFALSTRAISYSELTSLDVAVLRFSIPVLVLAPWARRSLRDVRQAPGWSCLLIAVGAGLPFFILSAVGSSLSSAIFLGVLNPGMPPLYVALIGLVVWKQGATSLVTSGYGAIIAGVVVLVAAAPAQIGSAAVGVLLAASFCWALYTVGLQHANLHPIGATLLVCGPSAVVSIGLVGFGTGSSHLFSAPLGQVAGFALVQGIGTGVVSSMAYTMAIQKLGARTAATLGASSPVLVAIAAMPVLGERVSGATTVGIVLVVAGILIVNFGRRSLAARAVPTLLPAESI